MPGSVLFISDSGRSFTLSEYCDNFYMTVDFLTGFVSLTSIQLCVSGVLAARIMLYLQAIPHWFQRRPFWKEARVYYSGAE